MSPQDRSDGFVPIEMFEFWEYAVTSFDKNTNAGVLFAAYVNMFLKLKQKSSGYSDTLRTTSTQKELL